MVVGVLDHALHAENRRTLAGRARWLQRTCARALRVLHVETVTAGVVPHGVMLAPNHVSYVDIIVLAAVAPTVFVSKAEVKSWPAYGWFAARAGTLFLRREVRADLVRVGAELQPVMEAGLNLVVFLEGTSTDGRGVRPFRASLLAPAVANGWPVVPTTMRYTVPPGRDAALEVAWWGSMPLMPHVVQLAGLPWVRSDVAFGAVRRAEGDRKVLAAQLRAAVAAALGDA